MKFRTRLLLVLLAVAAGTNAVAVLLMFRLSEHYLFEAFRSKVLSISATTAALVDGELHHKIQTRADEGSPAYVALREQLRRARDANRRDDVYVKYLVTLKPDPDDPSMIEFGVDPEESLRDVSHVGDVYRFSRGRAIRLDVAQVDENVREDQWGRWISATAPVRDSEGKTVAAIMTDVSVEELSAALKPLWISAFGCIAFAGLLAFGGAAILSKRISKPVHVLTDAVDRIGKGDLSTTVELRSNGEFGTLASAINQMTSGLRERETVKTAFSRYVSRQVMDSVLDDGRLPMLSGDRRKITVLFCDIRGFTAMSEKMRPEQVVQILNRYFEKMVEIVFRNGGTLDKFIGDGMMVIFGAPKDDPYQEETAIKTALEIREELLLMEPELAEQGLPPIRAGVGINSGNAIVGNIGASQRMDYTAIGDTVNLAARLESATRELNVDILISEYTFNAVRGSFKMSKIGPIHVKGRTDPVVTYTVDAVETSAKA